jgi:hypothetical protein
LRTWLSSIHSPALIFWAISGQEALQAFKLRTQPTARMFAVAHLAQLDPVAGADLLRS